MCHLRYAEVELMIANRHIIVVYCVHHINDIFTLRDRPQRPPARKVAARHHTHVGGCLQNVVALTRYLGIAVNGAMYIVIVQNDNVLQFNFGQLWLRRETHYREQYGKCKEYCAEKFHRCKNFYDSVQNYVFLFNL